MHEELLYTGTPKILKNKDLRGKTVSTQDLSPVTFNRQIKRHTVWIKKYAPPPPPHTHKDGSQQSGQLCCALLAISLPPSLESMPIIYVSISPLVHTVNLAKMGFLTSHLVHAVNIVKVIDLRECTPWFTP